MSPDVVVTTSLAGWINRVGVYSHTARDDHGESEQLMKWAPAPAGQHIELGISEMNLFMLLGQLGLSHEHHGHHLLPVGAVYDPFVLRDAARWSSPELLVEIPHSGGRVER